MAKRVTEVALRYKQVPFLPLPRSAVDSLEPNVMTLHIQPDEGITLSFAAKVPGQTFQVRTVPLDFRYGETFAERTPEAYERVLLDAFLGDATLFIRGDEVHTAWMLVEPAARRRPNGASSRRSPTRPEAGDRPRPTCSSPATTAGASREPPGRAARRRPTSRRRSRSS